MGALPPYPWDLAHYRQDFWGTGSSGALLPQNPGTESALGSHPCVALSSAQMPNSLDQPANLCHSVVGLQPASRAKNHPKFCPNIGVHLR
jgi:hypothetical protein